MTKTPGRWLTIALPILTVILAVLVTIFRSLEKGYEAEALKFANRALHLGTPQAAIPVLSQLAAANPTDSQIRLLFAQALLSTEKIDDAIEQLASVPLSDRRGEEAAIQLATLLWHTNRVGRAEALLNDCVRQFPLSPRFRQFRIDLYELQLRDDELWNDLEELWRIAETRAAQDRFWALVRMFILRFQPQKPEHRWDRLLGCEREEPDNRCTQTALAKVRLALRTDSPLAVAALSKLADQEPCGLAAATALAEQFVLFGGSDDDTIERLMARWETAPTARYWQILGDWRRGRRLLDDAEKAYRTALASEPGSSSTRHKLALLLIEKSRQSDPVDEKLAAEGRQFLESAQRLEALAVDGRKLCDRLREALEASGRERFGLWLQLPLVEEIARFCRDAECPRDAERWESLASDLKKPAPLDFGR